MCTAQGQFQATIFTTMLWYISVFTCKTLNSSLVNPEGKALTQDLPLELPHVLQVNTSEGVLGLSITQWQFSVIVYCHYHRHMNDSSVLIPPDTTVVYCTADNWCTTVLNIMLRIDFLNGMSIIKSHQFHPSNPLYTLLCRWNRQYLCTFVLPHVTKDAHVYQWQIRICISWTNTVLVYLLLGIIKIRVSMGVQNWKLKNLQLKNRYYIVQHVITK